MALNFAAVGFVNSSNISQLLRLRKHVLAAQKRLILCSVNAQVWGVFQVTGLDKIFEFTNDISTAGTYGGGNAYPTLGTTSTLEHGGANRLPNNQLENAGASGVVVVAGKGSLSLH